jgi:hypothetical protein
MGFSGFYKQTLNTFSASERRMDVGALTPAFGPGPPSRGNSFLDDLFESEPFAPFGETDHEQFEFVDEKCRDDGVTHGDEEYMFLDMEPVVRANVPAPVDTDGGKGVEPGPKRRRYRYDLVQVMTTSAHMGLSSMAGRDCELFTYASWAHQPSTLGPTVTDASQEEAIRKWFRSQPDSKGVQMVERAATSGDNPWTDMNTFMTTHDLFTNLERARLAPPGVRVRTNNLYNNMLAFTHPREPNINASRPQAIDWRQPKRRVDAVGNQTKYRRFRQVRVNEVHIALYNEAREDAQ